MKISLNASQRNLIAEKYMELANLTIVALVITQLLSEQFELRAAAIGIAVFILGYMLAVRTMKGGER